MGKTVGICALILCAFLKTNAFADGDKSKWIRAKVVNGKWTGIKHHNPSEFDRKYRQGMVSGWLHKSVIVNDPACPVQIVKAEIYRLAKSDKTLLVNARAKGASVSAVNFSVLLYGSFKKHAGTLDPLVFSFKQKEKMQWEFRHYLPKTFKGYGTACFFVRRVRKSNGQIWEMNTKRLSVLMLKKGCGGDLKELGKTIRKDSKGTRL